MVVQLVRSLPPAIEEKQVGRRQIRFKTLLIKAWHDLTYGAQIMVSYCFSQLAILLQFNLRTGSVKS